MVVNAYLWPKGTIHFQDAIRDGENEFSVRSLFCHFGLGESERKKKG
jgi:hypothetical protein